MTHKIYIFVLSALITLAAVSCIEDINEYKGEFGNKEVSFSINSIDVVLTRAGEENTVQNSTFLGMIGKDSLFLTATEEYMKLPEFTVANDTVGTKSDGRNSTAIQSSFQIAAFKDKETAPYVNLPVISSDNWVSYSPTLYWPIYYSNIHFFASNPNVDEIFTTSDTFKAEFPYTSPTEPDKNTDLIYAIAPDQKMKENNSSKVGLEFIHLLSSIEFKVPETIGDAKISNAIVEISNIIPSGNCSIEYKQEGYDVVWSSDGNPVTYIQPINGKDAYNNLIPTVSTKIIPQTPGNGTKIRLTFKVGEVEHTFEKQIGEIHSNESFAWEYNKKYTYSIVKGNEVKVNSSTDVIKVNNKPVLNNVKIVNNGFEKSYIRVAVIGYWYIMAPVDKEDPNSEKVEHIISAWDINENDQTIGVLTKDNNWDDKWLMGADGFYYYKEKLSPGDYTDIALFESYTLNAEGVSDSKLKIHIVVQAIEEEQASKNWPYPSKEGNDNTE